MKSIDPNLTSHQAGTVPCFTSSLSIKIGGGGGGGGEKERNVLFNDALNTFYLRLYGVRHMVKDHSDSEREGGRREKERERDSKHDWQFPHFHDIYHFSNMFNTKYMLNVC